MHGLGRTIILVTHGGHPVVGKVERIETLRNGHKLLVLVGPKGRSTFVLSPAAFSRLNLVPELFHV